MAEVIADSKTHYNRKGFIKVQGIVINKKLLNAVAATGASGHLDFKGVKKASLQLLGTFVGTIQIEGSNDAAVTFGQIGTDITTPGLIDIPTYCDFIRLNVSAFTSGTITGIVSGITD